MHLMCLECQCLAQMVAKQEQVHAVRHVAMKLQTYRIMGSNVLICRNHHTPRPALDQMAVAPACHWRRRAVADLLDLLS